MMARAFTLAHHEHQIVSARLRIIKLALRFLMKSHRIPSLAVDRAALYASALHHACCLSTSSSAIANPLAELGVAARAECVTPSF